PMRVHAVDPIVPTVAIQVQPAIEADGDRRDEPTDHRIVIALPEQLQPHPRLRAARILRLVAGAPGELELGRVVRVRAAGGGSFSNASNRMAEGNALRVLSES